MQNNATNNSLTTPCVFQEPVKNPGKGVPIQIAYHQNVRTNAFRNYLLSIWLDRNVHKLSTNFNCLMQITVAVTEPFLDYIKSHPILFEVFGHYQVGHQVIQLYSLLSKNLCSQFCSCIPCIKTQNKMECKYLNI